MFYTYAGDVLKLDGKIQSFFRPTFTAKKGAKTQPGKAFKRRSTPAPTKAVAPLAPSITTVPRQSPPASMFIATMQSRYNAVIGGGKGQNWGGLEWEHRHRRKNGNVECNRACGKLGASARGRALGARLSHSTNSWYLASIAIVMATIKLCSQPCAAKLALFSAFLKPLLQS